MDTKENQYWTVSELARLWSISPESVRSAIRAGKLCAVDVSFGEVNQRWRIPDASRLAFEASRTVGSIEAIPPPPAEPVGREPTPPRRRRMGAVEVEEFV